MENREMRYANYYSKSGLYHVSLPKIMGTRLDVLLFGNNNAHLEALWDNIERELYRLEKMLNCYDRGSEIYKVNSGAQFSSVVLPEEIWEIVLDCRRYYHLTNGYFDITLGDFNEIEFIEESHSVLFNKYGMKFDFGGYAKGYALRIMRKMLAENGIERALLNFGNSSVLALSSHPFGNVWPIGIESPYNGTCLKTIELKDTSMSVSGNSPANPQHILSPKTGERIDNKMMVCAVADDPVDAEVVTTAWIATGEQETPEWINEFNVKNTYLLNT